MLHFIQWRHLNKIVNCRDLENCGHVMMILVISFQIVKNQEKSSINEFLNDYNYLIDEFDRFIVDFSLIGLMDENIIYHDGTVLKCYCNNFKKLYAD